MRHRHAKPWATRALILAMLLGAGAHPTAHAQDPNPDEPVRLRFLSWFDSVFRTTGDPARAREFRGRIDGYLKEGRNVSLEIDAELTADKKSVWGLTWGGEVHSFPITPVHAQALGLVPGRIHITDRRRLEVHRRMAQPAFHVEPFGLASGMVLDRNKKNPAAITVKRLKSPVPSTILLRCGYELGGHAVTEEQFLKELPADGVLRFDLGPFNGESAPLPPLFIDLVATAPGESEGLVASNTLALLVDVKADADCLLRMALGKLNEVEDLLEDVTDRQSALRLFDHYRGLLLQVQYVFEAGDEALQSSEDKAALEEKHRGALETALKRWQVQFERMDRGGYAPEYRNRK